MTHIVWYSGCRPAQLVLRTHTGTRLVLIFHDSSGSCEQSLRTSLPARRLR
jgi:hypothetical protein